MFLLLLFLFLEPTPITSIVVEKCPDLLPFTVRDNTTFAVYGESDKDAFEKFNLPLHEKCFLSPTKYHYSTVAQTFTVHNFTSPSLKEYWRGNVVLISNCSEVNGTHEIVVVIAKMKKRTIEPYLPSLMLKDIVFSYMKKVLHVPSSIHSWNLDIGCSEFSELEKEYHNQSGLFKIVAGVFIAITGLVIGIYFKKVYKGNQINVIY